MDYSGISIIGAFTQEYTDDLAILGRGPFLETLLEFMQSAFEAEIG